MEIRGNSLPFRDRPHLLGVVRDISEEAATYRLLEARVQDRTRELSGLLSVSGRLAGVVDVADIPGVLVEEAEEVVTRSSFEVWQLKDGRLVTIRQPERAMALAEVPAPPSPSSRAPRCAAAVARLTAPSTTS